MRKNAAYLLFLILFMLSLIMLDPASSSASIIENTWTEKTPMPTARADLGVAVVNGKIYAIGGTVLTYQDAVRTDSKDVGTNEMYDPATNAWSAKKSMPIASSKFATAVFNNKIYCVGGGVTDFMNLSKASNWDVNITKGFNQVYDPATDTWENKTAMPIPQIESQATVVNGKLYFLEGHTNSTLTQIYDPVADSWTIGAPMPTGFYGASSVYSDKIYVVGSYGEGGYFDSNDHYVPYHEIPMAQVYDPKNDTWSLKEENGVSSGWKYPYALATSGLMAPPRIYVFYNPTNAPNNKLYENKVYDPATSSWKNGAGIPTQRNSFAVGIIDDLIYVIGGLTITFPIPTGRTNPTSITTMFSTVEQFTPFGYGTVPPVVSMVSLKNLASYASSEVPLNFSLNKPAVWMGYSLDGKDNVTVDGNTTITGLSVGIHNITMFAKDANENVGASETITFTIASLPFSTAPVVVSVAIVVIVGAGLLVYFKKRKKVHS